MPGKRGRPRKNPEPMVEAKQDVVDPLDLSIGVEDEKWVAVPPESEPHPSDREASRQAREDTRQGEGRRKRKPLGVAEQRLSARVPDGMTGRWMNDVPGRLTRALEGGYQFIGDDVEVVQNRKGGRSEIVGTGRNGAAMRAYLMAIPTVLYEQDQRAKAALNKERMTAIKRGEPSQVADQDRSAFYTPSEGISIRENTTSER